MLLLVCICQQLDKSIRFTVMHHRQSDMLVFKCSHQHGGYSLGLCTASMQKYK